MKATYDIHDHKEKLTQADFAWSVAEKAHRGQMRKDGSPYFDHPCRVADLVRHYKGDSHEVEALCAAAYLHDTLEDTDLTYYDLVKSFGYQVASLVLELTTNPEMKEGIGNKASYMSYKLKHMTHWALVIKLCDRLDNLRDTKACSDKWIQKYLFETAHILGYLVHNRELTPTHRRIMDDLWERCTEIAIQMNVELNKGAE